MTISVQVLDLGIVCPLMGNVEGRLDGAPIGVVTVSKEILVELLVQVIDGIIKGEKDKLGNLVRTVPSGDVSSSTVAVLKHKSEFIKFFEQLILWQDKEKDIQLVLTS